MPSNQQINPSVASKLAHPGRQINESTITPVTTPRFLPPGIIIDPVELQEAADDPFIPQPLFKKHNSCFEFCPQSG